jgi:thiamine-phosphate pyrophosphorylase
MFQSGTKPQKHIAGPEMLRAARARTDLPLVAIGGITARNVAEIRAAGAACIAACAAVIGAEDVAGAARALHGNLAGGSVR